MGKLSEKTTVYLSPQIKRFLKLRAVQQNKSISALINGQLAAHLEEFEDLKEIERRRNEPVIEWEVVKKELDNKHGL